MYLLYLHVTCTLFFHSHITVKHKVYYYSSHTHKETSTRTHKSTDFDGCGCVFICECDGKRENGTHMISLCTQKVYENYYLQGIQSIIYVEENQKGIWWYLGGIMYYSYIPTHRDFPLKTVRIA